MNALTAPEFNNRAAQLRDEIETAAERSRSEYSQKLADLCAFQAEEIGRLNDAIRDATQVPARHIVTLHGSIGVQDNGGAKTFVVALDNLGGGWCSTESPASGHFRWTAIPPLPTAAELAEEAALRAEMAESRNRAQAEAEQRRIEANR